MKPSFWAFVIAVILVLNLSASAQSAPVISGVIDNSVGNAIIPVGGAFWVNGAGFGDLQGSSALTLNGRVVTPYFWSATSVHAFMPTDTAPGPVGVQITNATTGASNTLNITVTGQPTVTVISPVNGPAGTTITITGTNFGSAPLPSPNTSAVWLSPGPQLTPSAWSDTQITATIPVGTTPSYATINVSVNGLQGSSPSQFTITPNPHINDIAPTSGSIGTQVTINGSGFAGPNVIHLVYIGGVPANIVTWSDTQVVATISAGAQTGTAYVAVPAPDGQSYANSNTLPFTVIVPQINSLSPVVGSAGTHVTITGSNFGSTRGSGNVYFNGVLASIEVWSDTSIAAIVPPVAASGKVTVVTALGVSNGALFRVPGSAAFVSGASMSSGRSAATATMLTNGQVLFAGGVANNPFGVTPSAALYDTASGTFSPTGNLVTGRSSHCATLLDSGLVLIIGGYDNSYAALSSAELYDPIAGTFSSTGTMNTARVSPSATLLSDGKVLIAGGLDSFGYPLGTAELYDPNAGTFSAVGFMTTARTGHTATLLGTGKVLLVGGYDGSFMDSASAELYDPASGSFSPTGSLNDPRDSHTATLLNSGTVLITGGWDPSALAAIQELYDPTSGTFSITGVLNNNRVEHTATLLNNGTVLVAGGSDENGFPLTSAELYDPDSGSFSVTANLNYARVNGTATLLNDQTVLVTDSQSQTTELYVPASTAPTTLVSINVSPASAVIPLGGVQQFTAVGTFVDNSTQTLRSVIWNSSSNAVATVTNDSTNQGRAYGVSDGSTTIAACAGSICGNATLSTSQIQVTQIEKNPVSVGSTACFDGFGFGTSPATSMVTINGVVVASSLWNDTRICVQIDSTVALGDAQVQVTNAQGTSALVDFIVTGQPSISSINPGSSGAGGQIQIVGTNFGVQQYLSSSVQYNGSTVQIVSWSDTVLLVTIPPGTPVGAGTLNVIVTDLDATGPFTVTGPPNVSSISPTSGPPGTQISIVGSNFGAARGTGAVQIGSQSMIVKSWSDSIISVVVPAGAFTDNIAVTTGADLASNALPFTVNYGGPLLQLSISDTPLHVNLTSPDVLDWIHWGRISSAIPDRKDGVAPLIGDYTVFNGAQPSASSGNIAFSWTDGNHPAVVSEANEDVETFNAGSGFQITVPADTAAKTLNLYAEVFFGQAVLQATLSDGSAAAISDQSVIDSDVGSKVYSIDFRAASPGQTLTVTFASAAASSGGVGLQAATLTPHLPVVGIASPSAGQSFTTSSVVPVNVNASQFDSSVNDVKAVNSDNTVLESPASPLNANLGPLVGGHYSIAGTATDTTALIGTSVPVEFDVIGQGGTLSIQENIPSSPVNLDVQGNADWVLWGPVNTGDFLFDLPGFILARKANVAPLISEYKPIGNHFITSQAFAHSLCFSGDQQNYCSGSEITVHGKGDGFEITVAADTTPRTLQLYVGTLAADGIVTAFLSDGSAPVATEVGGSGPPTTNATLYTINYSAASSGQTLTVRFTLNTDQGDGQVTLIGAAINGSSSGSIGPAPQISGISPNPGAANTKVTIAGTNFGSSQGQSSVYFGEVTAQIVNWSDTSIDVIVPGFLQPASTVQVGVVTANGSSNLVSFSTPIYTISPQNIAMLVGQARTVSVTDANGNTVTGLGWSTDDLAIVSLSTDDPPVITALAPGLATIWAGDVSFQITVYAGAALPPGTPIWTVPLGPGATTVASLVPAVPNDSGVDVFALDNAGFLSALTADGTLSRRIRVGSVDKIVPDFSGNALLMRPYQYTDANGLQHQTHDVAMIDPNSGQLTRIYTFNDHPTSDGQSFTDQQATQVIVPHTAGPLFVEDNQVNTCADCVGPAFAQYQVKTFVHVLDPSTGAAIADVPLENSTFEKTNVLGELTEPPFAGQMIVAGDGNAYVPYLYFTHHAHVTDQGDSDDYASHLMLLRVSSDGTYAKTELNSWTGTYSIDSTGVIHCSGAVLAPPPFGSLSLHAITNADQGVAVSLSGNFMLGFVSEFSSNRNDCGPLPPDLNQIIYGSQNGAVAAVNVALRNFVPALQREDGSYIGTDNDLQVDAVNRDGTVPWQARINPDAGGNGTSVTPLRATADAGVIVTSTKHNNGVTQLGSLFTLDQNGITSSQASDTGAVLSWTGNWFGSAASLGVAKLGLRFVDLALSFWPELDGNLSGTLQPPTLLITQIYPFPLHSTGLTPDQIKAKIRQLVPEDPKHDLPVTNTFLMGEDVNSREFIDTVEKTSNAVAYIGDTLFMQLTTEDGTSTLPVGLYMGTSAPDPDGGKMVEIKLVIAPNPAPPRGLEFLIPDTINRFYGPRKTFLVQQFPMQNRANVIFLGNCGDFSLPFEYWFSITGKDRILIAPTDANFDPSVADFLKVPGGVANFEWTEIAKGLAKRKTVAQAVDDANTKMQQTTFFTPGGDPYKVQKSFKWIPVPAGNANLKLRPTSQ